MSQYFIESNSKQPIFFSFNRIVKNLGTSLDFNFLINEFQEDFERQQQENWIQFWNKQGEDLIFETWNEKYKDYLKEEQDQQEVKESSESEEKVTEPKATESDIVFPEQILDDTDLNKQGEKAATPKEVEFDIIYPEKSWEDLWHEHRQEIYNEQYLIFSTIFYNYFLDFKKSCEISLTPTIDHEELEEEGNIKLVQDLEQLQILGLPTAFGGRPQNSSKKSKNLKKSIHYSDYFSNSDMENESSSDMSDIEDCNQEIITKENEVYDILHNIQQKPISKQQKRKRNRKLKNVPAFILEEKGLLKYWRKRFSLFSRFDEGIRLDRESWFSVTPEKVAKHLAERLKCSIIVDGFCGSGGNVIQFALICDKVIAIDIDPVKLEMAKHNAEIYKVAHKIEFILGDFLQLAAGGKLKADIVFLSPPWGGPKYKNKKEFDIEKYLLPVKASELVSVSKNIADNIALFLPRNSSVKQIVKLAGIGKRCEIEHNYLDSRLVAITALYGEEILSKLDTN